MNRLLADLDVTARELAKAALAAPFLLVAFALILAYIYAIGGPVR